MLVKTWQKNWCCSYKPGCGDSQLSHLGFAGHEPKSSVWQRVHGRGALCSLDRLCICIKPARVAPCISACCGWPTWWQGLKNYPVDFCRFIPEARHQKNHTPPKESSLPPPTPYLPNKGDSNQKNDLWGPTEQYEGVLMQGRCPLIVFLCKVQLGPFWWFNALVWNASVRLNRSMTYPLTWPPKWWCRGAAWLHSVTCVTSPPPYGRSWAIKSPLGHATMVSSNFRPQTHPT